MTKLLKFTGVLLVSLIVVLIIAIGILVTFVSPNKFKPIITSQVAKYTGRQLVIDGDLSWSFFPYLGVKMGHAVLSNPPEFKEKIFAEIDQATVAVKLEPLLHAKIEASGIALTGMTIHLVKNSDGKTNWQDLQKSKNATVAADPQPVKISTTSNKKMALSINVPSLDVNNAHITWSNEQAKQYADISHFELHATNINLDQAFPITSSFNFDAKNPTAAGEIALKGNIKLDLDAEMYQISTLDLNIKTKQNGKDLALNVQGDLAANLAQQTLSFTNFVGRLSNLTLTGKVDVTDLTANPRVKGHLQAQPFDLKQLLDSLGQNTTSLQVVKNVTADFDFSTTPSPKATALQTLNANGNVKIESLQAAKVKASDLRINAHLQNGIVDLSPITASLYQGTLNSQAKVNLNSATPQFTLQGKLANVQAEPLVQDLGGANQKIKVKGAGNVDLQVTTAGTSANAIEQNLNGSGHINFVNGQLDGINIGYLIDSAYSIIKGQSAPTENEKVTNFGNLTGSVTIHNGVISNNDLSMDSPRFNTKGQGTIDLVNQKIDYQLQANPSVGSQQSTSNQAVDVNKMSIPIRISGSLTDPSIRLDTAAIAKEVAKQQVQRVEDKVKLKIQDTLKGKLPGNANEMLQGLFGNKN